MTDTKRTPGPWFYQQAFDPDYGTGTRKMSHEVHDAHGETIVVCADERTGRLTAAAPDLLAALEDLVKSNCGHPRMVTVPALDKARAAIAKANGEEI